jgi:hypothetical protein
MVNAHEAEPDVELATVDETGRVARIRPSMP